MAEEAALTAEALGNQMERLYDVGVAGLHRLMSHMDSIMNARVIIAIAGMEGALASVIGGLADCPVWRCRRVSDTGLLRRCLCAPFDAELLRERRQCGKY